MNFARALSLLPIRRSNAVLCAFALAAAFLAGCDNNPNPKPLRDQRPDGSPWVVRYGALLDEPRSLDPQYSYDQMSRQVLEPIIETLLEYHPMKTDPYEVVPCLLEAMPERVANADGTVTYVCRLKRGIRWHDDPCFPGGKGRELVAEDVHFAWQRICDPKVECPVLSTLQEYVVGLGEVFEAAKKSGQPFDYTQRLRGLEVVDSHTFKVHLNKSYPQIIYWLAMHFTTPTAREAVAYYDGKSHPDGPGGKSQVRDKFGFHPVGTGPFVFREYTPGHRVRMERNPHYITTVFPTDGWPPERDAVNRPLAGKPLPFLDEIQLTLFREQLPVFLLGRQGYLDAMAVQKDAFNSVVTPSRELSPKYRARGMRLEKDIDPSCFWLDFNMQDPVVGKNKKLRQAMSCAFNAQGWIDIFYNGVPPVAQQLVPPGIFGYDPDFKNPYGFDLERGKRLIAEAGYPGGRDPKTGKQLELTMDVTATGAWERQSAEYEQRQFEQLGIKVRIIENTFARKTEKQDQGNFQIIANGWGADYPDPENFFFLFYGKNFPPAGKNSGRYSNPEFDRLFEQMALMENSPERLEIVKKMNAIFGEDVPGIFLFNKAFFTMVQPFAPRTHNNRMLEPGLKYSIVDPVLREQKRREWNPPARWPIGVALLLVTGAVVYGVKLNRRRNI